MAKSSATPTTKSNSWRRWLIISNGILALCISSVTLWLVYDSLTFRPIGEIAYECHRYGTGYIDICIVNANGSNQSVLIQFDQQSAVSPAWSFDGKKLAFISNSSLYVADNDGSSITQVISNVVDGKVLDWAPQDYRLLIWANISDVEGLYAVDINAENSLPMYIAPKIFGYSFPAIWHPNGNEILASTKTDDSPSSGHEIVRFTFPDLLMEKLGFSCSDMAIKPSGNTLACRDFNELILRDISTGDNKSITNWSILLSGIRAPTWSSDGQYIVYFQPSPVSFLDDRSGELWIMRADGSHPVKLTNGGGDRNPAWRPEP